MITLFIKLHWPENSESSSSLPVYDTWWSIFTVPIYCWTSSREAVIVNFYSLWLDSTENRTRVYGFSSRLLSIRLLIGSINVFAGTNPWLEQNCNWFNFWLLRIRGHHILSRFRKFCSKNWNQSDVHKWADDVRNIFSIIQVNSSSCKLISSLYWTLVCAVLN